MPIIATSNNTPRELIPAGNYVAICYEMIQIGTVTETINGDVKQLHKVRIGWEFPNDKKVFSEEKGEQPLVFSEEYTLSMGEKSNLRRMLESWRGQGFSPDEAKSFDITKLIGKSCMVNIIHVPKKNDPSKSYAKISSVSKIPNGFTAPPQILPTSILSYDAFDWDKFNALPDFIKDKMKNSLEFAALVTPTAAQTVRGHEDGQPAPARDGVGNVITQPEAIDDLPF